jgi:hypothetical protein
MKHISIATCLTAGLALTQYAKAENSMKVVWNQVCLASSGQELLLTTSSGDTITGYCASVTVNELALRDSRGKVVKVARGALARIQMRSPERHPLRSLGKGMHNGFHQGFEWLLSPMAPLGLVTLPGTVAWGAIAAPFCALGEIKAAGKKTPLREITVL